MHYGDRKNGTEWPDSKTPVMINQIKKKIKYDKTKQLSNSNSRHEQILVKTC